VTPDVRRSLQTLNENIDQLRAILARVNELFVHGARASDGDSLYAFADLLSRIPRMNQRPENLNSSFDYSRLEYSTILTDVEAITIDARPLLDKLTIINARAEEVLDRVNSTARNNRAVDRMPVRQLRKTRSQLAAPPGQLMQRFDQNSASIDTALSDLNVTAESLRTSTETLLRYLTSMNQRDGFAAAEVWTIPK
jgi:hypothetical protein